MTRSYIAGFIKLFQLYIFRGNFIIIIYLGF